MKKVRAIRSGEGRDMGTKQLDVGCAAIGVGHVNHGGAIVCQVEVHQAIDGKALTAPVYVVQNGLPGGKRKGQCHHCQNVCAHHNYATTTTRC